MADKTASWVVRLKDEISGAAETAAQALKKLDSAIAADTQELAGMQRALKNLKLATKPNTEEIDKLTAAIAAQKQSIATQQQQYLQLGGTFGGAGRAGRGLQSRMAALTKSVKDVPGPLGFLLAQLNNLKGLVGGGAMATGILAAAAAVVALTGATVGAVVALYNFGISFANLRRNELASLGGMRDIQDAIDEVARGTPHTRKEVAAFAEQLYKAGMRGENLRAALEKKFGGAAASEMLSLGVQLEKMREAFGELFKDLNIGAYLAAWKSLRDLLSQNTASGRALKAIMQSLLQPLINAATAALPIVKRFFQGVILAALDLTIWLLNLALAWRKAFGSPEQKKSAEDVEKWITIGQVAIGAFAIGLGLAAVAAVGLAMKLTTLLIPALARMAFGPLIGAGKGLGSMAVGLWDLGKAAVAAAPGLWAAVAPMLPFILAAIGVGAAIASLIYYWDELKIAFQQVDWGQAGIDAVNGIIDGLLFGPRLIADAMTGLGNAAITAFKKVIGAASPAKMFVRVGTTIPEGVAVGIEQGTPEAQAAAAALVDVPKVGGGAPATGGALGAGAAGGVGGSTTIEIGQVVVNATSSDPKQLAMDFRRELERVLEGLAFELGAHVPGGGAPA